MGMIRLQEMTPDVYVNESRDFQVLCRSYDCVLNGLKFDIDTIPYIVDTKHCRADMLQLLQTKLGFFTNVKFRDDTLRLVLGAFPEIIKNKGSLKAVKQSVNVFLKSLGINTGVAIWQVQSSTTLNNESVGDHTIVIGIETSVKDTTLLDELFKYALPTGYDYKFYFYSTDKFEDKYNLEMNAKLLFASDDIMSSIRYNTYDTYMSNQYMNAIDTMEIMSSDSETTTNKLVEKEVSESE